MKVLQIPAWTIENPFVEELQSALRQEGCSSRTSEELSEIFRSLFWERPQAIHLHWFEFLFSDSVRESYIRAATFCLLLSAHKLLGARIIWTVHNLEPHQPIHPRLTILTRWILSKLCSQVISLSHSGLPSIQKVLGLSHKKAKVIPHGHYIESYPNQTTKSESRRLLGIPDNVFLFTFLGQIRAYKGLEDLMTAFQSLNRADTALLLAGKPTDAELVHAIEAAAQKSSGRIFFEPRFIPNDEVQLFANAADVFVFPYRKILNSGSVFLAMSFARAFIAPATGSLIDFHRDPFAILYGKGQKSPDLYCAMANALDERAKFSERGELALNAARSFDWSVIAKMHKEVYTHAP